MGLLRVLATAALVLATAACDDRGELREESPGLAARAAVSAEAATATAEAWLPGGKISEAELEEEDGRLVYSFDAQVEGQAGIEEIHVDAMTGDVLSQAHESDAEEAAEAFEVGAVVTLVEESPGLLARARVTDEEARSAALATMPGGRIVKAELEEEDSLLIYSYDLRVEGRNGIDEVHVDANTGEVVKVEHESGGDASP